MPPSGLQAVWQADTILHIASTQKQSSQLFLLHFIHDNIAVLYV